jgi:hypothetical protein
MFVRYCCSYSRNFGNLSPNWGCIIGMVIWNIAFSFGISIVLASPHVTTATAATTTTSKAMVSSSLPSSTTKCTVTPYPYQDEDFTIPQVRSRPIRQRIAQSKTTATTKSKLQSPPLSPTTIAATLSNHQWFIVTWTTISIIKVLLHNYISNEMWKNLRIWGDPLLNRVPTWITHRLVGNTTIASATTPPPNDQDDDDDFVVVVQGDEKKEMVIEEEDDDEEADPSWTSWADRYHDLLMETTTLREQLDHRTLPVEPPSPPPQNEEEKEEMIQTIQTMNETLHYWKRVALMKDEQIQRVLQAERQNSIQQLEQLKTDMLRVVEQERAALLLEFQNMMTQLRESISLVENNRG